MSDTFQRVQGMGVFFRRGKQSNRVMESGELIQAIQAERAQVEAQLVASVGASSLCALEKSNRVTRSMKYLEGQQQAYSGAIKTLRAGGELEVLLNYLREETTKNTEMLRGPLGASRHWQEYFTASLAALERIQELSNRTNRTTP